jgi:phosphatidate cytidylyltransferase
MGIKRLLTAAAVLPLLILYITKLPPYCYAALLALVSAGAQAELYAMYRVRGPLFITGIVLGPLIVGAMYFSFSMADLLALCLIVVASVRLFMKRDPSAALKEMAPVVFGLLYIPVLIGCQVNLRAEGPGWILFLYGTVWCADAAAYYIGKGMGKRKLYESVSPKKTVAGGVGSVLGGIGGALIFKALAVPSLALDVAIVSGALTGVVTIVGDLVESMLKRDAGVKDSGALVPAHGGVLDKIDGAVFAGPVLFWLLTALGGFG